ncbi:MAG: PRC-barrel domain-containing protein [Thermoplasmata archaeon]|nr:PRC-barrel domain-containing protein [Thermoplasmata archaeon]
MKKFATEMIGMAIFSHKGEQLGILDNYVVDTNTGDLIHILVTPSPNLDTRRFRVDSQSRLVMPFKNIVSIKDVIVVRTKTPKAF